MKIKEDTITKTPINKKETRKISIDTEKTEKIQTNFQKPNKIKTPKNSIGKTLNGQEKSIQNSIERMIKARLVSHCYNY